MDNFSFSKQKSFLEIPFKPGNEYKTFTRNNEILCINSALNKKKTGLMINLYITQI